MFKDCFIITLKLGYVFYEYTIIMNNFIIS